MISQYFIHNGFITALHNPAAVIPCLRAAGRQWLREENPPPRITPAEGCVNGPRPYSLRSADTLGKQADVRPPLYRCRGPCHTKPKFQLSVQSSLPSFVG